ncbi:NAD(P)-dependent oxidoreductase [Thermodesulfobacteriota bacterium]
MPKIFISTLPFGEVEPRPISLLEETGWKFMINPLEKKLSPNEVVEMALDCDGIIAGTEDLRPLIDRSKKLKIIARVGIGLDSVPLALCKEKGIKVIYTPDAVTMAVAELTVGIMIGLTRHVYLADKNFRCGEWERKQGKRIGKSIIGIIGFGRIGTNVARLLIPFHPHQVLVNDLNDKSVEIQKFKKHGLSIRHTDKKEIYQNADIITLHVPLYLKTKGMINAQTFHQFKQDVYLINLARGGIINEADLFDALKEKRIGGAALDCFEQEPYCGTLTGLDNILLTQHIGSCSFDCRMKMEIEATEDLIRYFKNEPLKNEVPEEEFWYQLQV